MSSIGRLRYAAEIVGPFVLAAIVGLILAWRGWPSDDILIFTSILTVLIYISLILYELQHALPSHLKESTEASHEHLSKTVDRGLLGQALDGAADLRPHFQAIAGHTVQLSTARTQSSMTSTDRFLSEELYDIAGRGIRKLEAQLNGMTDPARIVIHQSEALSYELLERLVERAQKELLGITDWSLTAGHGGRDEVAQWWRRNAEPFLVAHQAANTRGCAVGRVFIVPDGFCADPTTDEELRLIINQHIDLGLSIYVMPESKKGSCAELLETRGYTVIDPGHHDALVVLYYQHVDSLPELSPALILKRRTYDASAVESTERLYDRLVQKCEPCDRHL